MKRDRRRALWSLATALTWPLSARAAALLEPTPRQPAGPFYPEELPLDDDNDLTKVRGRDGQAEGRVTDLSGRLLAADGTPVAGARVEIWQCDARGRYRHPRDASRATPDPNFQGHGQTLTDAEGRYRFRTIRPVPYPGRTPHIHIAVFSEWGEPVLVTQLYIAGEPRNARDFLYRSVAAEARERVEAAFLAAAQPGLADTAQFDIVLAGAAATPAQA